MKPRFDTLNAIAAVGLMWTTGAFSKLMENDGSPVQNYGLAASTVLGIACMVRLIYRWR